MPWAANPIQEAASPRKGEGNLKAKLTKSSEALGKEEEEEKVEEKETTFIEDSQLRARPLSPLVVHSRGEDDEGGEESLDYSTEETPAVVRINYF